MSLADYEDFVFSAGLLHDPDPTRAWQQLSQRQARLVDRLHQVRELHFLTPNGTDLRLAVAGRAWINCDARHNFPDGEVFTAPLEDSDRRRRPLRLSRGPCRPGSAGRSPGRFAQAGWWRPRPCGAKTS